MLSEIIFKLNSFILNHFFISLQEASVCLVQTMCLTKVTNSRNWICKGAGFFWEFADIVSYTKNCMNFTKLWRTFLSMLRENHLLQAGAGEMQQPSSCHLWNVHRKTLMDKIGFGLKQEFSSWCIVSILVLKNFYRDLTTVFLRKYSNFQLKMTIQWETIINTYTCGWITREIESNLKEWILISFLQTYGSETFP